MMITPESGRPSDVAITLPWFAIATVPNAAIGDPHRLHGERSPVHPGDLRTTGGDASIHDAEWVERRDDQRDQVAREVREGVTVGVVDPAVLDDDRAALLELVQDHALPDQKTGERDDERRDADERDDRPLHAADHCAGGDRDHHRQDAVQLVPASRAAGARQRSTHRSRRGTRSTGRSHRGEARTRRRTRASPCRPSG